MPLSLSVMNHGVFLSLKPINNCHSSLPRPLHGIFGSHHILYRVFMFVLCGFLFYIHCLEMVAIENLEMCDLSCLPLPVDTTNKFHRSWNRVPMTCVLFFLLQFAFDRLFCCSLQTSRCLRTSMHAPIKRTSATASVML